MADSRVLDGWQFRFEDQWLDASVPTHIHLDLMRHGIIADPFIGQNERDCQWVDERDWTYRCSFDWQPAVGRPNRFLLFEGLDTVCSIFLNGDQIAEHDNMFVPLEVDVSGHLRAGQNEIKVEFQSAARVGRERKAAYLREQKLAEDVPNFDERAFVRKAQYMFGWDWGPRLVSCGIWKPVLLSEVGVAESDSSHRSHRGGILLEKEPDAWGETFQFSVNGKPFYALGANWIPDHSFPSIVDRDRLKKRLTTAKEMGVNMIRIWGGGAYESDDFYDLCDEQGILIWQDFMFACSYYPDDEEWQRKIREEAELQVRRLRSHPCIAIWCGNNECHQVWEDGWGGKDKQPPRFHGEVLYHEVLKDVVARLDPDRPYWPGSPYGGDYCNSGGIGDQHYWDVWHGRGDWTYYRESTARFCSEFGFASSPSAATWRRAGVSTEVPKEDPVARWHNKTGKPFETFTGLVELHYPQARSLDEWSYYSQLNQRDAMRAALEHFRFSGHCRGALVWQLNDCWPVESWSLLEFEGRKKAAAFECKRLFAPLILRITLEGGRATLEACLHNSEQPVSATGSLAAYELRSGENLGSVEFEGHLERDDIKELAILEYQGDALLVGSLGETHCFLAAAHPKGIHSSPPVKARVQGCTVDLESDRPVVDLYIEDAQNPENTFDPNFFSLLAGSRIRVEAAESVRELKMKCLDFSL